MRNPPRTLCRAAEPLIEKASDNPTIAGSRLIRLILLRKLANRISRLPLLKMLTRFLSNKSFFQTRDLTFNSQNLRRVSKFRITMLDQERKPNYEVTWSRSSIHAFFDCVVSSYMINLFSSCEILQNGEERFGVAIKWRMPCIEHRSLISSSCQPNLSN